MVLDRQVIKHSVREFNTDKDSFSDIVRYLWYRGALLPSKYDTRRERALFDFYWNDHNWLIRGAFGSIAKQIASTPSEIKGDQPRLVRYFEDVLSQSEFGPYGGGLRGLLTRLATNFLCFDHGALVEIIGKGNPKSAIKGRVESIAILDNLRCRFTGIPEYPVDYWSRKGDIYRLHWTRVGNIVDMPSSVEEWHGAGDCALARAISIMQQQIVMDRYNIQRLDDLPPAGILLLHNVKGWQDSKALYEAARVREGSDIWASIHEIESLDPAANASVEFVPFASTPEHFDYEKYLRVLVNATALALGVDPQDIWPLSGGQLGTGTQSQILHVKGAGKTLADLRTAITRFINFYILPDSLEFQFKFKDAEQDKQTAETEKVLVDVANQLKGVFDVEIAAQYLVDTSERFANVLLDEAGQLRLPSDDPKPEVEPLVVNPGDVTAESETPTTSDTDTAPTDQTTADSDTPLEQKKDIQATRLDFEADWSDAIEAGRDNDVNRRRLGIVLRAHLSKYIRKAFEEGLIKGGVNEPPDENDMNTIAGMIAAQSGYVSDFTATLYKDGLTDAQAAIKAAQWWVQSIQPAYYAGIDSADRNGLYEWVLGLAEHCNTCKRLAGQIHRMVDWIKKGYWPGCDKLDCHPGECKCTLVRRRNAKARGRF